MTAVMLIALIAGFYLVDSRAQAREQVFGKSVRKIQGALISVEDTLGRVHGITKALPLEGIETKIGGIQTELSLVRQEIEAIKTRPGGKFVSGMSELKTRVASLALQIGDVVASQSSIEESLEAALDKVSRNLAKVSTDLTELRTTSRFAKGIAESFGPARGKVAAVAKLSKELASKVEMLASEDPSVRWTAVDELLRSGESAAVPYLIPSLKDADPFVRRLCAEGFGKLRDLRSLEPLLASMEDSEAIVRGAAYRSLIKVAKHNLPFDPEASEKKRNAYIKKWHEWLAARSK